MDTNLRICWEYWWDRDKDRIQRSLHRSLIFSYYVYPYER